MGTPYGNEKGWDYSIVHACFLRLQELFPSCFVPSSSQQVNGESSSNCPFMLSDFLDIGYNQVASMVDLSHMLLRSTKKSALTFMPVNYPLIPILVDMLSLVPPREVTKRHIRDLQVTRISPYRLESMPSSMFSEENTQSHSKESSEVALHKTSYDTINNAIMSFDTHIENHHHEKRPNQAFLDSLPSSNFPITVSIRSPQLYPHIDVLSTHYTYRLRFDISILISISIYIICGFFFFKNMYKHLLSDE